MISSQITFDEQQHQRKTESFAVCFYSMNKRETKAGNSRRNAQELALPRPKEEGAAVDDGCGGGGDEGEEGFREG